MSRTRGRTVRRIRLAPPANRLRIGLIMMLIVLTVFAGRLVQIQGIDAHAYAELADKYEGAQRVELTAARGRIVDRDGMPLAQSVKAKMLVADPTRTADDAPEIAAVISRRLDADYLDLVRRLRKPGTRFVYLARRVLPADADQVMTELESRDLAGVYTEPDPLRTYPAGDVAANLVGFVGSDGDGLAGLERYFDDRLHGKDGHATYVTDRNGTRIPLAENSETDPVPGVGLQLTLDQDLQFYAQRRLAQRVRETGALSGVAVVLDTRTSEVLALADYPTFDANDPGDADKADRGSRALQDVYEPGSVAKVLTAASVIDAGKVTPRTKIEVPEVLKRGPDTIKDWFGHGDIRLTFAGVIAQSSNIGTAIAAEQLTHEQFHDYLSSFGIGERTGVAVGGESAGLLPPASSWLPISQDTIAFGQGYSVNALQMAAAVAAIANGGVYTAPTLVEGFLEGDGTVDPADAPATHRVVSERAARQTTEMMQMVTSDEGTAPIAQIPGYQVAGKTGTAQRVDPEKGGYATGGYTVSFAGFAPADDPRILTYVVLQKPSSNVGGGTGAGPVFKDITAYALQKYGVPPTKARTPDLPLTW